jgi:hypothetical protein
LETGVTIPRIHYGESTGGRFLPPVAAKPWGQHPEIARDHQFLELERFAVTYRTTFGESPSATLHRDRPE